MSEFTEDTRCPEIPKIEMFTGPMFSGKTSSLISRLEGYTKFDVDVLFIKPKIDTRTFMTHSGVLDLGFSEAPPFEVEIAESLSSVNIEGYKYIAIDEAQFFPDLELVLKWRDQGKKVYISCLDLNYKKQAFANVALVTPHCKLHKIKSICDMCLREGRTEIRTAIYTKRLTTETDEILIGGLETYTPRCAKHFNTN